MLFARLPPHLDDADLGQQRVLDEGIEHDEAGVLLHEDVIDVVRLLLGGGNVLRPDRLEPHHLVAGREDVHQRRHQAFDRVGDVGRHRLRAAVGRRHVARHVAEVIVERGRALLRQLGRRHRGQGVGLLRGEHRSQLCIGHFRHGGSGHLSGLVTQQRALTAPRGGSHGETTARAADRRSDRSAKRRPCALLDGDLFHEIWVRKSTDILRMRSRGPLRQAISGAEQGPPADASGRQRPDASKRRSVRVLRDGSASRQRVPRLGRRVATP